MKTMALKPRKELSTSRTLSVVGIAALLSHAPQKDSYFPQN
jgi:hypothetical protein